MKVKVQDKPSQLKEILLEVLTLLGVSGEVEAKLKEDETIALSISTENPALLIGYHGKTASALQTVLGVMAYKKFGERIRILIDVDGWRKRRDEVVAQLASSAAQRAKETNTPQPIFNLTPYERRIVHMALAEDSEIVTESEGEGRERHIVVKPKSDKQ